MKTLESLEDVQNLPDGLKTFLCDSVQDLIAVEKELNENLYRKYKDVVQNLVLYNPFHPHYSSPDVISTFSDKGKRKYKANPQNTLKFMFFSEYFFPASTWLTAFPSSDFLSPPFVSTWTTAEMSWMTKARSISRLALLISAFQLLAVSGMFRA